MSLVSIDFYTGFDQKFSDFRERSRFVILKIQMNFDRMRAELDS